MQIKKLLGSVALAAVLVGSLEAAAGVKTGPYVGVNVGYANVNAHGKYTDNVAGNAQVKLENKKGAMQANLFAGYESMVTDSLIAGGELTFGTSFSGPKKDWNADTTNAVQDPRRVKVKQRWKVGLYGLVGTPLSDRVSLYGKLGLLYSSFGMKAMNDGGPLGATGANSSRFEKNTSVWGIEPGVRLKVALNDALAAHLDASYAWYQTAKKAEVLPGVTAAAQKSFVKYQPRIWGITAGISYKF